MNASTRRLLRVLALCAVLAVLAFAIGVDLDIVRANAALVPTR
jgi:hypothetical protein